MEKSDCMTSKNPLVFTSNPRQAKHSVDGCWSSWGKFQSPMNWFGGKIGSFMFGSWFGTGFRKLRSNVNDLSYFESRAHRFFFARFFCRVRDCLSFGKQTETSASGR